MLSLDSQTACLASVPRTQPDSFYVYQPSPASAIGDQARPLFQRTSAAPTSSQRYRNTMPKVLSAEEQVACLDKMDGEFLRILEDAEVPKEVRALFGHFGILKVRSFAKLEPDEQSMRELIKKGFEIGEGISERIVIAHILVAWDSAKERIKRQAEAITEAKVHGTTPELPKGEDNSMRQAFEGVHGEISDMIYPSNDYLKSKLDQVEEELYEAEPLSEVISREHAVSGNSDVTLTLIPSALRVSKIKHKIAMPKDSEQLRARMKTMAMCWELTRMRYPERRTLKDLTGQVFTELVEYLLGELVWQFRGLADQQITWSDLLEYEWQIRKRAMRWVRQQMYTVGDAIAKAMKDQEVRTTFFLTQLACSKPRKRERSPPTFPRGQPSNQPRNPQQQQNKGKGSKGKGGKGKGKGNKNDGGGGVNADTNAVNQAKKYEVLLTAAPGSGKAICIRFNKNNCPGCGFEHVCLRCGEGHRLTQCPKPPTYK